jgi:hypothetical protein
MNCSIAVIASAAKQSRNLYCGSGLPRSLRLLAMMKGFLR